MQVMFPNCVGIDVHKKSVFVCLVRTKADGQVEREVRTFSTTTRARLEWLDWRVAAGGTQVAMESTGVYGKPGFNRLESAVEVWWINPQHSQALPGRKTDVKGCEWIADWMRHGLLRRSFIAVPETTASGRGPEEVQPFRRIPVGA